MARDSYQWWEVTAEYVQIKFVESLDSTTLINDNIHLYTTAGSPTLVSDPFETIEVAKDFSSISRLLTLWWKTDLDLSTDSYVLEFENLKDFIGNPLPEFSFIFEWTADYATPKQVLRPTREPIEVEDYSIKTPGWSIIEFPTSSSGSSTNLTILDQLPSVKYGYSLSTTENNGVIQILFDRPIASNFITPLYFSLSSKEVKRGISQWELVNSLVMGNSDSTLISIYLPGMPVVESATPIIDPIYSYAMSEEEIEDYIFFEKFKKYRLILAAGIGSP